MKRRLITSTLAVVLVVIALFSVALGVVETRSIQSNAQSQVTTEALHLIGVVENRLVADEPIDAEALSGLASQNGQRYALVTVPGQAPITLGSRPTGGDPITARETGAHGEQVLVQQSREPLDREIRNMLLLLGLVAVLTVVAAMSLAVWQSRRLAQPLVDLAETAERLGSGDPRPGSAATASSSSTGSPRCWTPARNGSAGCSPLSADSLPTPPTSSGRR